MCMYETIIAALESERHYSEDKLLTVADRRLLVVCVGLTAGAYRPCHARRPRTQEETNVLP